MNQSKIAQAIERGQAVLGIELGSTRIKAVLIDEDCFPIAKGEHNWENRLEDGIWTYHLDDVWTGIQGAYAELIRDVEKTYGVTLRKLAGFGISAMMHGYLPLDKYGNQLAAFRTWRNTMTEQAAAELTELLHFNIPQRWSIAHLRQAMIAHEAHLPQLDKLATLAVYVHWKLTGKFVAGIGEASGMFPIDSEALDYNQMMIKKMDELVASDGYMWRMRDILPKVLSAGDDAGSLTEEGAQLLDPTGMLEAGIPAAPPEGDAGTGMVATNSVAVQTGNVSAGTSVFAMIVLDRTLSKVYPEIDMVTTPTGKPVAMVHCNNCTSDINAWAGMLAGFSEALGTQVSANTIYTTLFNAACSGDSDCDGVLNINYFSGEPITGFETGRPMLVRMPESKLSFENFARSLVFGAMTTLRVGMEILTVQEKVQVKTILGHGGFFKTKNAGQQLMAAALNTPISVMETAGEGGPWGMALLASYRVNKENGESLEDYLNRCVFASAESLTLSPEAKDVAGFDAYLKLFRQGLSVQRAAVETINA